MDFSDEDKVKMFDKIRDYLRENYSPDEDVTLIPDPWERGRHWALHEIDNIVRGG